MSENRELRLCEDCKDFAVNDELPAESSQRRDREIVKGLTELMKDGMQVLPDFGDSEDNIQECYECGFIFPLADGIILPDPDGEGGENYCCPECKSPELRTRDNGEYECENVPCDCCGTTLAGKRFRFIHFSLEENHVETDPSNPLPGKA